jgi:hypothetical protein
MKSFLLFILDLIGYFFLFIGSGGLLIGLAVIIGHGKDGLLFILGGVLSIIVGLLLTYLAAKKDKKRFISKLFDDFIISLLPPW